MTDTRFTSVLYNVRDRVATLTLNRPDVLNCFNRQLRRDLFDAVMAASRDEAVRVVILTDDCGLGDARRRLARFVMADARQVIGIFSVLGCVTVVATMLLVLAAAGLAVIAWMPFASVVVVPLQLAAGIVRGLIFEYFALSAVSAYQTQYRRFSTAEGTISIERSPQLVLVDDDGAVDRRDGEERHPRAVGGDGNRLE